MTEKKIGLAMRVAWVTSQRWSAIHLVAPPRGKNEEGLDQVLCGEFVNHEAHVVFNPPPQWPRPLCHKCAGAVMAMVDAK